MISEDFWLTDYNNFTSIYRNNHTISTDNSFCMCHKQSLDCL